MYAAEGLYRPTVTLVDGVGNARLVQLAPIVPGDKTAPVGTFVTSPATAWEALTTVNVTQTALSDDFSAAGDVLRWVDWGDGGGPLAWTGAVSASHVYAVAGTYTPWVVVKDEAGNVRSIPAQPVTVQADTVLPVVKVTLPKKAVRDEVGAWKKLAGTGHRHQWNRRGQRRRPGDREARDGLVLLQGDQQDLAQGRRPRPRPGSGPRPPWSTRPPRVPGSCRLAGLKKGTLFVRATATDLAGNVSKPVTQKAVLTAP